MPLGLLRFHHSGESHFITFGCYRGLRHLEALAVRDAFVSGLEKARTRYQFRVYGYVVMPDHVHILISEPEYGTVATAIQSMKISSSITSAEARLLDSRRSPLWQKRYYDRNVSSYEEFVAYLRYIHRNPIKKGLCNKPEDWEWSSYRHYVTGERGPVEIESEWTVKEREKTRTR